MNKLDKNITFPGFEWGMAAGIVTIATTTILWVLIFFLTPLGQFLKVAMIDLYVFTIFFVVINYICAIIMITSSILIKHEDHSLSGSILILSISAFGLLLSIGLWIGPLLGIISGIVGLKEHHKLIKMHHGILHQHHKILSKR